MGIIELKYFIYFATFFYRPSGWDNEKKISILYESMSSMKPDDNFDDVISKPPMRKVSTSSESKLGEI